jgi:hypothetical protein
MIEKIKTYESKNPWIFWSIYYFIFLIFVGIFSFGYAELNIALHPTDVNSARYLLSTLIQSQASIIAIVITLTLVAVQITVSTYSSRAAGIFLKSPHLYLIFLIYVFSMGFETLALQMITTNEGAVSTDLEYMISYSIWLTIFLALALIPYLKNTIDGLNPEKIAMELTKKLDKNVVISQKLTDTNLDSIFDIIHTGIKRLDLAVVKQCLESLTQKISEYASSKSPQPENFKIFHTYSRHLYRCAQLAINVRDEDLLLVILANFQIILEDTIKLHDDNSTNDIIETLDQIHVICIDNDFRKSLLEILSILYQISNNTTDDESTFSTKPNAPLKLANASMTLCIEKIGKGALDKSSEWQKSDPYFKIFDNSVEDLKKISKYAVSKKNFLTISHSIPRICSIENHAFKINHIDDAGYCVSVILGIWEYAIDSDWDLLLCPIWDCMYLSIKMKDYYFTHHSTNYFNYDNTLMRIGIKSQKKGLSHSANYVTYTLIPELKRIDPIGFDLMLKEFIKTIDEEDKNIILDIIMRTNKT